MTIEERIISKFIEYLRIDNAVSSETAQKIEALWKDGNLSNVEAILDAIKIKKEVQDNGKNQAT